MYLLFIVFFSSIFSLIFSGLIVYLIEEWIPRSLGYLQNRSRRAVLSKLRARILSLPGIFKGSANSKEVVSLKFDFFLRLDKQTKESLPRMLSRALPRGRDLLHLRTLWGFHGEPVRIIGSTLEDERERGFGYATGEGEICAVSLLSPSLYWLYGRNHVWVSLSKSPTKDYKESSLILLGGPDRNDVTREVIEKLDLTLRFIDDGTVLYDSVSERRYVIGLNESDKVVRDYGMFIKTRSPFRENRTVFILAGCRTFGTLASACFMMDSASIRTMVRSFGADYFEAVVSGKWNPNPHGWPVSGEILAMRHLKC